MYAIKTNNNIKSVGEESIMVAFNLQAANSARECNGRFDASVTAPLCWRCILGNPATAPGCAYVVKFWF